MEEMLKHQQELCRAYYEEKRLRKLMKNREEKRRAKERKEQEKQE